MCQEDFLNYTNKDNYFLVDSPIMPLGLFLPDLFNVINIKTKYILQIKLRAKKKIFFTVLCITLSTMTDI